MSCGKLIRVEASSGRDSLPVDAVITLGLSKSMLCSKWRTAVSNVGELVFSVIWNTVTIHPTEKPMERFTKREVLFSFSSHVFMKGLGGSGERARALGTLDKLFSELHAQPQ